MPDLITVSVTAQDLACGWGRFISSLRRACEHCPVEHAATRAVGEQVLVNGELIYLERSQKGGGSVDCVVLPDAVRYAIVRIDSGLAVEPFTFQIERPK